MANGWNELTGELRSALTARDWHQAGAVVWQLRQLDGERFTLELEHYTIEQARKGGCGMTLETEQRLEAVRQWAKAIVEHEEGQELLEYLTSFEPLDRGSTPYEIFLAIDAKPQALLDWDVSVDEGARYLRLRSDMRDILWSVLQSHQRKLQEEEG